jgi:hypothetical protein
MKSNFYSNINFNKILFKLDHSLEFSYFWGRNIILEIYELSILNLDYIQLINNFNFNFIVYIFFGQIDW